MRIGGSGYTGRVTDLESDATGESPGAFSIVPPPECELTLTYPAGGESLQAGDEVVITWSSSEVCGSTVVIELLQEGVVCATVAAAAANNGSYAWTCNFTKDLTAGETYNFVAMGQEFGGGQTFNWWYTTPTIAERLVNPGAVDQAGEWRRLLGAQNLGNLEMYDNTTLILSDHNGTPGAGEVIFDSVLTATNAGIQGTVTVSGGAGHTLNPGGTAVGSEMDFATGYLRHVLGFLGIDDVQIVAADRLMARGEEEAIRNARAQIDRLIPSAEPLAATA